MNDIREQIARTLRQVYDNGTPRHRYTPRAIGKGPGWKVWDRKQERHLTDEEVLGIDPLEPRHYG